MAKTHHRPHSPPDPQPTPSSEIRTVAPSSQPRVVRTVAGELLAVPETWEHLPPGDAALTRRVKTAGPHWVIQEKVGRKLFSRGLWAPRETIESIRGTLASERQTEGYAKRRDDAARRRAREQSAYVDTFCQAVLEFLRFAPQHAEFARQLALAVTTHATPVGSGTVARTQRIPVAERAEAAVIAWMRHQTTAYDSLKIPRVKGKRREVRRELAAESHRVLDGYRRGIPVSETCPLQRALARPAHAKPTVT